MKPKGNEKNQTEIRNIRAAISLMQDEYGSKN